ncbi:hypothetical protein M4L90_12335 [Staphylococcus equorum]|uniref:Uncharacterized protein n=1 Tax=Staphylococcus equorum TaxID=246432 RepID=A0A9X4QZW6_9STAP|nr:hypothetical protein [Staphylococcus equorum]MDG0820708.1 hypothetical protein [Staphylococcus equorum]MDG0841333.1 hypothetical protein [Staphylococcus equorum]MDG0847033.1 hypothetical protein [Staphylococcus equorum]PTE82308.1 hypothetical protein BUY85_00795 [Staphylococcus equorum]
MELSNNANFDLQELREIVTGESWGTAIDIDFRDNSYSFSKEDGHILVNVNSENVGHLNFENFDVVSFENWDTDQIIIISWLDELDAHLFEYQV